MNECRELRQPVVTSSNDRLDAFIRRRTHRQQFNNHNVSHDTLAQWPCTQAGGLGAKVGSSQQGPGGVALIRCWEKVPIRVPGGGAPCEVWVKGRESPARSRG